MEATRAVADLESFLAERGDYLLRSAVLLTGSREAGEDLLQAALERVLRRWRAIEGNPEGYIRRTMYHLAADGWRQKRSWQKQLSLLRPGVSAAGRDPMAEVDLRDSLVRLLIQLPPRQRAVIVARYFEQLTEAESAEVLGCSVGTVKSAAARGLRRLRELSEPGSGAVAARPTSTRERTR
jgi:RNA polymerase sigma-70 factor (sigma-E family)